jgi:CheY-like chemotaxis protein/putative methionine-R-sulfoxide reductase with GAF domain
MDVVPIINNHNEVDRFFVVLSDISQLVILDQKLSSIQTAGRDLANISSSDLLEMSTEQRLDILAQKIALYTDNILNFGNYEIRLLSHKEHGLLEPLVYSGMNEDAVARQLYRAVSGNGITGYVAFTAEPYLMEDADADSLYLPGAANAKSSMTVPLINQGEVIGTFNVESTERSAFTKSDLKMLETFARDIAHAINVMELISVEQMDSAFKSIEAIHGAVAGPINQIQLEAARVLAIHENLDIDIVEQIRSIQKHALDIQNVIHKVGDRLAPAYANPNPPNKTPHPLLKGRRIFVVDPDESVGLMINSLLQRYGCIVEMSPDGAQALLRARVNPFDVIISDIKLPDMDAYNLLQGLRDIMRATFVPLILMKGYGYDSGHVLVRSKQEGVIGFLAKPFILDQVLTTIELVINETITHNRGNVS